MQLYILRRRSCCLSSLINVLTRYKIEYAKDQEKNKTNEIVFIFFFLLCQGAIDMFIYIHSKAAELSHHKNVMILNTTYLAL